LARHLGPLWKIDRYPTLGISSGRVWHVAAARPATGGITLTKRYWVAFAALALLGCSSPAARVPSDIESLERQEFSDKAQIEILSVGAGEGDSDNVYYLVDVVVKAKAKVVMSRGPFDNLVLEAGETSKPMRLELLYQWRQERWRLESVTAPVAP
jgi:hypothetical protein